MKLRDLLLRVRRGPLAGTPPFRAEIVETGRLMEVFLVPTGERFVVPETTVRFVTTEEFR